MCWLCSPCEEDKEAPAEDLRGHAPYEDHEHCGDRDVAHKGHKVVLGNLKQEPDQGRSSQKSGRHIYVLPK